MYYDPGPKRNADVNSPQGGASYGNGPYVNGSYDNGTYGDLYGNAQYAGDPYESQRGNGSYGNNAYGNAPYGNSPYANGPYENNPYTDGSYPPPPGRYPTGPYASGTNRAPNRGKGGGPRVQSRFFLMLAVLALGGVVLFMLLRNGAGGRRGGVATVQEQIIGSQFQGDGIIVRNEKLTDAESITSIDFVAEEGSLVYQNTVLCYVYSAGYNEAEISRLESYREQIQEYHREQVMNNYVDDSLSALDGAISTLAMDVRKLVQGQASGSLTNLEKQITDALVARKEYLSQKYPHDQDLATLYKDESQQIKRIESWTTSYIAQEESVVSFYTDGYETTLNADTYEDITPQEARAVLSGQKLEVDLVTRGRQPIYRTVLPNDWYILLLTNDRNWNPAEGQIYKVKLEGFENYLVDATVHSFTRVGGEILVRMAVHSDVRPVLNIRTCRMSVGEFVEGLLSVPLESVFEQDGMMGVAVRGPSGDSFTPVTVVSSDAKNHYVQPVYAGSLLPGQTVLTF